MTAKPARRWFTFSLRSLLVVVTLVCCWLGWQSYVVRQRKQALADLLSRPAISLTTAANYPVRFPPGSDGPPLATIPLIRQWLGDQAIQEIEYMRDFHDLKPEEVARLAGTFPEARVRETEPLYEPCHPGCFPAGTLVDTPQGRRRIETIAAGDSITAFLPSGERIAASVQSVFITDNRLWLVSTEEGNLLTTETQPLCLAADRTAAAGELQTGECILRGEGREFRPVQVLWVAPTDRTTKVFNLVLGGNERFLAGGFLARSKPPGDQ